ncbi:EamA family transporter [Tunturiibacter gelidoferens]|uniref:Drug/metabolite transporter (DMT)-like permease n=1 Tax=Tunturiibacter gelidiferens TaxID=3069689 RepID=A0ACC5P379_9BACT|nr:EamA family transporter [Edaphobacter lichenicola]MBB5341307.1 drug/metabolite transporter (DMT)-like permease [Edaphobacter lichenicola]
MEMLVHGNALLALAAAVLWGGGDFSGGMGVKHAGGSMGAALRVILLSHAMSFSVLLTVALLRGDQFPHGAPLVWGLAAGVAGGTSLTAFYIALSRGAMGASAALSGLLAAAIPAAVSAAIEGSPGLLHISGFLVAGMAIWLIAAGDNAEAEPADTGTFWLAIAGGVGFGVYFVALKLAGTTGVIWPLATARMGSLSVCMLMLLARSVTSKRGGAKVVVTGRVMLWALSTALLDTSGNLLFLAATRAGRLDVAAVLASLYPASTILLAAWMLRERPTRRQGLGMAVAAAAVVMVTL